MNIYGKKTVLERIKHDPKSIKKLYLQQRTDLSEIVRCLKVEKIQFDSISKDEFERIMPGVLTQGVVAIVDEFLYYSFDEIRHEILKNVSVPVFLDNITDPQNLGAIMRNLACMGGFSIVIPEFNSAEITPSVLKVACGADNYIKIIKVKNISTALANIKQSIPSLRVIGALVDAERNISEIELPEKIAIVMGSEGKGIRPGVLKHVDVPVTLPMDGAPLSYNVSVAAAILCYEIKKYM